MFNKAVFKLTFYYSLFFFILFWSFSAGLYLYLENSFRGGYVSRVHERFRHEIDSSGRHEVTREFSVTQNNSLLNKSIQLTLENFGKGLFLVNVCLLFLIPAVSWILAKKTLLPLQSNLQKQKRFISDASHELRTPLTIASNEIEVALQQERPAPYYKKTLAAVKEEISRLSTLVASLLLLAQHENTSAKVFMSDVEVIDVISKAVASLRVKLQEKKIRSQMNFPEDNVVVKGNVTMLEQLFVNLIDNAVKFSHEEATITVSIEKKAHHAEISIQDEGMGIKKEEQEKIFDRFYRVDASRTQTKGYGLGLAIAKTIAEVHGGSIAVSSSFGKGSKFIVILPSL
ncbi:MAG: HAMP domain-containing sensor histidine kinase [Candidatus Omnitrophota bacterium]